MPSDISWDYGAHASLEHTPAECSSPEQVASECTQIAASARRCFARTDGREVLDYLVATTVRRALSPDISDAALWYHEGQRALVLRLVRLADVGGHARPMDP